MARPGKYSPEVRDRAVRMVARAWSGASVAVVRDHLDRQQVRLHGGDVAEVGSPGRARQRSAWRSNNGRAAAVQGTGTGEP